jgi:uncharacterized protein YdcH (DUF465 family)
MEQLFGDESSPLRENPVFRKYMEEYTFYDQRVQELNTRRGMLSYEEVLELTKLKKLKLSTRDSIEQVKRVVGGSTR